MPAAGNAAIVSALVPTLLLFCATPANAGALTNKLKHDAWAYPLTGAGTCSCNETAMCGPDKWNQCDGDSACGESNTQSPIDALFTGAEESATETTADLILDSTADGCEDATYMVNEHTAEVEFESECGFSVTWKGKMFKLKQYHYHSPSEHTVDGGYYPMEVHHVHQANDGQALVLAVMVNFGQGASGDSQVFFDDIFDSFPDPTANSDTNFHSTKTTYTAGSPYEKFIPSLASGFYEYLGAFTTPPCTTNTQWIMVKDSVTLQPAGLVTYRKLINDNGINQLGTFGQITGGAADAVPTWHQAVESNKAEFTWDATQGCNNRPIQALGGRKLMLVPPSTTSKSEAQATTEGAVSGGRVAVEPLAFLVAVVIAAQLL